MRRGFGLAIAAERYTADRVAPLLARLTTESAFAARTAAVSRRLITDGAARAAAAILTLTR